MSDTHSVATESHLLTPGSEQRARTHRLPTQAIPVQSAAPLSHVPARRRDARAPESSPRRARSRPTGPARPIILGILNVTPDSFSDGGRHGDVDSAVEFAVRLVEAGADVVDVGGESTRPGADRTPVEEEQRRVLPVVRELAARGIPVSIDTMNSWTAGAAVELGAAIVNDVSAGTADADMPRVVAELGVMFIAMHSRGPSSTMNARAVYRDTVAEVRRELEFRVAHLIAHGVDPDLIVVDPGLGFAKNSEQNWSLLGALRSIGALGHPVLVGASRKRFLGELLPDGAAVHERDAATAVISALAAEAGAWGVRVHDVAATRAALDVWTAMNGRPG